jgi:hypothetical protein
MFNECFEYFIFIKFIPNQYTKCFHNIILKNYYVNKLKICNINRNFDTK